MSAPVTAEELASVAQLDVSECSNISAGWCPVHGDCTCPRDGTDTREEQADDCPLHGTASNHGDDEDEPPQIARSLVLRLARELEALRVAVRAHEADARASGHATPPRDLALWAAAKA